MSRRHSSYWIARMDIEFPQLTKRKLVMGLLELTEGNMDLGLLK
jgi:hypothetical protein